MHPDYLVLESYLDPSTQYPKLPQPESRDEHTYLTGLFAN